ncbi:oxygenase MpaB family protein [Nocardia sp. NPDC005366]|uniref:oxygenase MpaB family protein n=1 Tax=Nocardia sp. NPDC005366 TaxID=3156878 RepID=UPI0033A41DEA
MTEHGLDPNSLLGRYLGDRRFILALPRAVGLQILHPSIAAGITAHTSTRLWYHKQRAVTQMIHLAYGSRSPRATIRYGHEIVHGLDSRGRRYHALDPKLFFFQHATYVDSLVTAVEMFAHPLTDADKETLYGQCRDWYARYGISARHMPDTWPEFTEYLADMCANELAPSPDSDRLAPELLRPDAWLPKTVPDFAVRTMLHERTRELLGVPLRRGDRAATAAYATMVKSGMRALPPRARHIAVARNAS